MRLVIAALGMLLTAFAAHAEDVNVVSGDYGDGMLIAFDPTTRIVSGYYYSTTGRGQFSCIFYLTGKLQGSTSSISTYFPDTPADDLIKGELAIETNKQLQIRLPSEHGGCWNVQHFADKQQPAKFKLRSAHPWIEVAVVKHARTYFFDNPANATHRKGYLVKGDGVGVRGTQPGWFQVDFVSGNKPISGWIKQSDVYPPR